MHQHLLDNFGSLEREHAAELERMRRETEAEQRLLEVARQRLTDGDPAAVELAVRHALRALPFSAALAGLNGSVASIAVALPPAEDAVPEREPSFTPTGKATSRKLNSGQRNDLFCELVCGAALSAARRSMAAASALTETRVIVLVDEPGHSPAVAHCAVRRANCERWRSDTDVVEAFYEADGCVERAGRTRAVQPLDRDAARDVEPTLRAVIGGFAERPDRETYRRHVRPGPSLTLACLAAALAVGAATGDEPAWATTCAAYSNQAAAQRSADTRDGDGDGIYCESLPCPCAAATARQPHAEPSAPSCARPRGIVNISFSATRYPNIRAHFLAALRHRWPRTLVLNRRGSDARRDRLLSRYPTRPGRDRDEYPPAVGRGKGRGLASGRNPRGWLADVKYVPSAENRSHGAVLGIKLRRFCDGTRFRYVFYSSPVGSADRLATCPPTTRTSGPSAHERRACASASTRARRSPACSRLSRSARSCRSSSAACPTTSQARSGAAPTGRLSGSTRARLWSASASRSRTSSDMSAAVTGTRPWILRRRSRATRMIRGRCRPTRSRRSCSRRARV